MGSSKEISTRAWQCRTCHSVALHVRGNADRYGTFFEEFPSEVTCAWCKGQSVETNPAGFDLFALFGVEKPSAAQVAEADARLTSMVPEEAHKAEVVRLKVALGEQIIRANKAADSEGEARSRVAELERRLGKLAFDGER